MSGTDDFIDHLFEAHKRSYQRAFGTALRTGTALIFEEDGKLIEIRPSYRDMLVQISKKKSK